MTFNCQKCKCIPNSCLISLSVHTMFINISEDRQNNCLTYVPGLRVLLNRNTKMIGMGAEEEYREREEGRQSTLCGKWTNNTRFLHFHSISVTIAMSELWDLHCSWITRTRLHFLYSKMSWACMVPSLRSGFFKKKTYISRLGKAKKPIWNIQMLILFYLFIFFKLNRYMSVLWKLNWKTHMAGASKSSINCLNL